MGITYLIPVVLKYSLSRIVFLFLPVHILDWAFVLDSALLQTAFHCNNFTKASLNTVKHVA